MSVSPTLAINEEIARRRAAGLDTVALGFGEASIPVHPALLDQLAQHAGAGGYGPVAGSPDLLDAAAAWWSRRGVPTDPGQIISAPGSKPLLYALFQALGSPVLLPKPSWVSYAAQNLLLGQTAPMISTRRGEGGVPDPELLDLEAARLRGAGTPPTAVLLTLPDNPTGTAAGPDTVRALCEVAEKHDLTVISDEIYLDLVHDGAEILTPAQVAPERTITTTGLSKNLALGGWRLGLARFPDNVRHQDVRRRVAEAASEIWSAAAQPVQLAAAWAYTEPPELRARLVASQRLHGRIARVVAEVFTEAGADVPPPTAGFYLYPDFSRVADRMGPITTSPQLAQALLEGHGIATLPGAAFGDDPERLTLRVATPMLYGRDGGQRQEALDSAEPERLPWIAGSLEMLRVALAGLTNTASPPRFLA